MPKEVFGRGFDFLPRGEVLHFEEIARLARVFVSLGVEKIRLTGGEPLVRAQIERLVEMIASLEGLKDLALTTNGSLLAQKARALRDAGLHRLTVSLDSLDDAVFRRMNDADFPVARVLEGIDAALAAGFAPIKINVVVRRGCNDDGVVEMARRFSGPEFVLRFIEFMDVGTTNGWRLDEVVPADEIVRNIAAAVPLEPLESNYRGETARRWCVKKESNGARYEYAGEIGLIASVTQPFCRDCTRARLTADGRLYTCLFGTHGHDLRARLRGGQSDTEMAEAIAAVWRARDDRYSELRALGGVGRAKVEMSRLGG